MSPFLETLVASAIGITSLAGLRIAVLFTTRPALRSTAAAPRPTARPTDPDHGRRSPS
jgi:hypothetical protein